MSTVDNGRHVDVRDSWWRVMLMSIFCMLFKCTHAWFMKMRENMMNYSVYVVGDFYNVSRNVMYFDLLYTTNLYTNWFYSYHVGSIGMFGDWVFWGYPNGSYTYLIGECGRLWHPVKDE